MKPISLLLKRDQDVATGDVDHKEPTWNDPYPNVVGEFKNGKYIIPNETTTVETKVNENLGKDSENGKSGIIYGNKDASHSKLDNKTQIINYKTNENNENATTVEVTVQSAA
jgi:hypothetical protein